MNGWMITGIVLLVLFLLLQLRIGAALVYGQDDLKVSVRLGPGYITVYPRPKKEEKQKKKKPDQEKKKKAAENTEKKGKKLTLEQLLDLAQRFIPLALEAAGCLWNKLVMDDLQVSVTVGSHDPADTAMLYGQINSGLSALWVPFTQAFHVKNGRAHVGIDFDAGSILLYVRTEISIKIGQVLWIAIYFGVKALKQLFRYQKSKNTKAKERKAV